MHRLLLMIPLAACYHAAPVTPPVSSDLGPIRPRGIVWDGVHEHLLVADDATLSLLYWIDGQVKTAIRLTPEHAPDDGVSGVAMAPDGTAVVALTGSAHVPGGIVRVTPDGQVIPVPGLAPERRRAGVAVAGDGAIASAWTIGRPGAPPTLGGVELVTSTGAVHDIAMGLKQPAGVAVQVDRLWISDRMDNVVLSCTLPTCRDLRTVAHVLHPDLISTAPRGGVFVASGGDIVRAQESGMTTIVARGFARPRAIAVDTVRERLFVVDGDAISAIDLRRKMK